MTYPSERAKRGHDIIAKLSRAIRPRPPEPPLPTADEFERLLDRFECEFTRARCTYVWTSTWLELRALSYRLFADKGDLREYYARDYAFDLLVARNIEGLDDSIRQIGPDDLRIRTLDQIASHYLSRSSSAMGEATVYSHLSIVVSAYSPDDTPQLEIVDRMIEVLRRNGAIPEDDRVFSHRASVARWEREDRYNREREQERSAPQSSVVPAQT